MAKNKTHETTENVEDFIASFTNSEQKRQDSFELIKIMQDLTGFEPKMWGPYIIGFGSYHYRYESGHEGDMSLIGFSPRKNAISLYEFTGKEEHEYLLKDLGNFRKGKSCIYINKLSDINRDELKKLSRETIKFLNSEYGKNST